ncbi:unnamed protein product [Vicia faba]|uniref:Uncharacterized protein n=1 Tax=Vicia faba TaxID=3906 RepID=A0AAV0ZKP6_VICFA|nr:unnamed protein product [Vicia faba]
MSASKNLSGLGEWWLSVERNMAIGVRPISTRVHETTLFQSFKTPKIRRNGPSREGFVMKSAKNPKMTAFEKNHRVCDYPNPTIRKSPSPLSKKHVAAKPDSFTSSRHDAVTFFYYISDESCSPSSTSLLNLTFMTAFHHFDSKFHLSSDLNVREAYKVKKRKQYILPTRETIWCFFNICIFSFSSFFDSLHPSSFC